MEWTMPVNEMLREEITKIGHTLLPPGFHGDIRSVRVVQESLSRLIDALGEQSAAAQGLSKVITTAKKLRNSPTHSLYLLKDAGANGGKGEVVGMLKVGRKHLFLFDDRDTVREMEPLCVLDFFVLATRQRHGLGRRLFDYMLKEERGLRAEQLAIDGPSPKMEHFLRKNYGVERLVRQNNNFAVGPNFFAANNEISRSGRNTPVATPAVGRFAAHKPPSAIATVIHGGGGSPYHSENSRSASRVATPDGTLEEATAPAPAAKTPEPASEPDVVPELVAAAEAALSLERPTSLKVEAVSSPATQAAQAQGSRPLSPAGCTTPRRDSQLTERGYFDIKFYHNKLW